MRNLHFQPVSTLAGRRPQVIACVGVPICAWSDGELLGTA